MADGDDEKESNTRRDTLVTCGSVCVYVCVWECVCMYVWLCGCQQTSTNMQQFEYFQLANCLLFIDGTTITSRKREREGAGKQEGGEAEKAVRGDKQTG